MQDGISSLGVGSLRGKCLLNTGLTSGRAELAAVRQARCAALWLSQRQPHLQLATAATACVSQALPMTGLPVLAAGTTHCMQGLCLLSCCAASQGLSSLLV
jgi:hypothetical protein